MNEYRGSISEKPPNWRLRRILKWGWRFGGILAVVGIIQSCRWVCVKSEKDHWGDKNWGWCCAKPQHWCRQVTECTHSNNNYCERYEQMEKCDDLCHEWLKREGSDGETCR
jgi:hypothetical protein